MKYIIELGHSGRFAAHYECTSTGWTTDKKKAKRYKREEIDEIETKAPYRYQYIIHEVDE